VGRINGHAFPFLKDLQISHFLKAIICKPLLLYDEQKNMGTKITMCNAKTSLTLANRLAYVNCKHKIKVKEMSVSNPT
jgi:hypothetical protein